MATLHATRPKSSVQPADRVLTDEAFEFYHYEDTGCEVSDSCLDCPLPRCRYDDPEWYRLNRRLAKDFRIVQVMEQERLTVEETAERFSVTIRTVFRIVQRCREATMQGAGSMEAFPFAA